MSKLHLILLMAGLSLLFGLALADEKAENPSKPAPHSVESGAKKAESIEGEPKAKEDDAKAPVAVVKEIVYDAGAIKQGTPLQHVFTIKNEGNVDLKILKARGG